MQLVVFGGTTIVNGLMHYPKDIFSFDLGEHVPVVLVG